MIIRKLIKLRKFLIADWTDVRRRTVEGNAKFRELTVN